MYSKLTHKSFPQTSNDQEKVWRYMNMAKFINLVLTKSLYCTRIDLLGDLHEGSYTKLLANKNPNPPKFKDNADNEETSLERRLRMRKTMFVNCWRIDNYESEAMWKLYCPNNEGLAIQTSYKKLADSMIKKTDVYIGLINYLDYETETFDDINIFNSVMHKRRAFEHEKEIRIVKAETESWNNSALKVTKEGTTLKWDLFENIEAIYINPYADQWYFETVNSLLKKMQINFPIKWSNIKSDPYF